MAELEAGGGGRVLNRNLEPSQMPNQDEEAEEKEALRSGLNSEDFGLGRRPRREAKRRAWEFLGCIMEAPASKVSPAIVTVAVLPPTILWRSRRWMSVRHEALTELQLYCLRKYVNEAPLIPAPITQT